MQTANSLTIWTCSETGNQANWEAEANRSEQHTTAMSVVRHTHPPQHAATIKRLTRPTPSLVLPCSAAHGLSGSKRCAVNSKIFFGSFRKDPIPFHRRSYIPSMIHINYHQDKLERVLAIEQYYFHGNARPVQHMTD